MYVYIIYIYIIIYIYYIYYILYYIYIYLFNTIFTHKYVYIYILYHTYLRSIAPGLLSLASLITCRVLKIPWKPRGDRNLAKMWGKWMGK